MTEVIGLSIYLVINTLTVLYIHHRLSKVEDLISPGINHTPPKVK
jgi:hypothetical protein